MSTRSNYELYHIFRQGSRSAKVYNTEAGFEVDLYEENELIETREVHDHSERYAEDCAENWVMRIF
tara:strand:- start:2234 stop:2431 length:198 start_codon:yes stop_codon:yes gene_type:complete